MASHTTSTGLSAGSSAGTFSASLKRGREPPSSSRDPFSPTARFAAEYEAADVLGHQRDVTEATVTGADDDAAEWAYGGAYYLQDSVVQRLNQQHGGRRVPVASEGLGPSSVLVDGPRRGGSALGEEEASQQPRVELLVNPAMAFPAFFQSGNDFPAVAPPSRAPLLDANGDEVSRSATGTSEEADPLTTALWQQASNADMDIILPVVSSTCALAASATKGSALLGELKRTMDRERINRDAMDTSKSNLTQLLQKDVAGRFVGDAPNANTTATTRYEDHRDAEQECRAEVEEEEALRRKLRMERDKLASTSSTANTAPLPATTTATSAATRLAAPPATAQKEEEERARRQLEERQRRKVEKLEQISTQQARLSEAQHTDAEEAHRAALRESRRQLPIHRCKDELLRYIGENIVTVVVGETGSGKTTQLVQYLYERGYARHDKIIGCTQPRRLAAVGVARRVSEEMGCALGTTVGYSIHLDDTTTEATKVKFMTDGVLLREIVKDPDVEKYSVIILDEAHERSVDTDVLMGVLKLAVARRGDLKLVVTSATMDIHKFARFFGNAPYYEIPGQTYDVEIRYSPSPVADYVAEAVFRVCQLHLQMPLEGKHDILVFMTGRDDVYGTCELIKRRLQELNPAYLDTLLILPCLSEASSLSATAEAGVLDEAPPGKRKCVVATNVAETSLTIDGVRYVVDAGFMKTNVFRPKIGMNTLQRYPISQAQAGQRKGRAGRTTEGVCFRLFTDEQFQHEMLPNSVPEIQRSSVDSVVLLLKSIGVLRLVDFDFMDPPPAANVRNSMWRLWVLGLLDDGGRITEAGQRALEFPMSPSLATVLVESTAQGCSLEMARIVAVVTADPKNLFELPKGKEELAQQHHGRFFSNDSDHLTLLNVFSQFLDNGRSRQWAMDHFLHVPTLVRACDVLEQLLERLRRLRLPITSCGLGGLDTVRYCLAKAFCLQAAQRSGANWSEYRPLLNLGVTCTIHPSSSVCTRAEMPPYVIYNDLLLMAKEYLVMVTAVEPEWLVEGSRGLYHVRRGRHPAHVASPTSASSTAAPSPRPPPVPPPPGKTAAPASAVVAKRPPTTGPSKTSLLTGRRRQNI